MATTPNRISLGTGVLFFQTAGERQQKPGNYQADCPLRRTVIDDPGEQSGSEEQQPEPPHVFPDPVRVEPHSQLEGLVGVSAGFAGRPHHDQADNQHHQCYQDNACVH